MKSRPTKAKRTLADFIRGNPADSLADSQADSLAHADLEFQECVEPPARAEPRSKTKRPAKKKSSAKPKSDGSQSDGSQPPIPELSETEVLEAEPAEQEPASNDRLQANPAPAFLDAIVDLADFRSALDRWVRKETFYWDGAWLGAVAPLACAAQRLTRRPLLILVAHHQDAETLARDIEFFHDNSCLVFPPASEDPDEDSLQQQEVIQRLQVLAQIDRYRMGLHSIPPILVTTLQALMCSVPSPDQLRNDRRVLEVGKTVQLSELKQWLAGAGYRVTTAVQMAGEFTARGGILDVFPPDSAEPYRIEFFDNEIESIRSFDTVSQRSIQRVDRVDLLAAKEATREQAVLLDYCSEDWMVLFSEPTAGLHHAAAFRDRIPFPERFRDPIEVYQRLETLAFAQIGQLAAEGHSGELIRIPISDVQRIGGELENIPKEIDACLGSDRRAVIVCINDGELSRMREILESCQAAKTGRVVLVVGLLSSGFEIPHGAFILTVNQILRRAMLKRASRKHASRAIDTFLDLRPGDLVVHLSHGIGIYLGMEIISKEGQKVEHLTLEFDGGTKLYVPTANIDLVQRYIGGTKTRPKLAKIGGQAWARQKQAAQTAVQDMAAELLELQAQRQAQTGITFKPDSIWQKQFEASFPYEETPDQLTAIEAAKKDMISNRPMERLICGDVGFGKTEVAMRAAFKAVESGYQVAVLVPTTVLAEQHYKSFRRRMAEFPFEIAKISRFETGAEQNETLKKLANGQVDILIGTHRLASADVKFFNLGLLIVDEEQKFGVELKERIKKTTTKVDVLTLSATPIPRTLHMSLVGIRDISNLETPPEDRMSIETRVVRWNDAMIRNAILRELNRDGQIYFVHNRIEDMHSVAARLQRIAPEARIVIGHGQMAEHGLEQVMLDFIEHRADILLSTTIIESGLDISNANTMFIDEADRYGLSELHQLRGRVGRYRHQAHCYLLVDRNKHLNPDAARRLHAIEEFSQLGAGFGIAMRDLEIRGAGNLLGTQQSGHIAAVGYELYCQLLDQAVRQMTKSPLKLSLDVDVQLPVEAYLPPEYIQDMRHKIDVYRRISRLQDIQSISQMRQELEDRFGQIPRPVERLLEIAELRMDATLWSIKAIDLQNHFLRFSYSDHRRISQLAQKHTGKLRLVERDLQAFWSLADDVVPSPNKPSPNAPSLHKPGPYKPSPNKSSLYKPDIAKPDIAKPAAGASPEPNVAEMLASLDLLAVLRAILRL
ncbi:MAG: transcription-repair coupling factor [Pirellula sp.]